jgi:hypothetical protein
VVLGVGAAVIAYLLVGSDDTTSTAPVAPPPPPAVVQPTIPAIPARIVTQEELKAEASTSDHPIYWAGPRPGVRYELTRSTDGRVYVRYLTGDAAVGDPNANYLAVATYPQAGGFDAILGEAAKAGNSRIDLPAGGVAVVIPDRPSSVYLSYPGADYQVEVFAPSPGKAERLVRQSQVRPLGGGTPVATGEALALKLLALRTIARRTPFYWAGARPHTTYELTQTPEGRIFVRYLSGSAKVGDRRAKFLTIATYPAANAFAQIKSVANKKGIVTLELPHGGLAVLNPKRPTSVYLGYPGVAYQVEVFSPKLGEARALVESGKITRAG